MSSMILTVIIVPVMYLVVDTFNEKWGSGKVKSKEWVVLPAIGHSWYCVKSMN